MSSTDEFPPQVPGPALDAPSESEPLNAPPAEAAAPSRFQSCRWRRPAENGSPECCVHRDVLPMAGTRGFSPDAWCADCTFYKARRAARKRPVVERDPYFYY